MSEENSLILITDNEPSRMKVHEILKSIYGDSSIITSFSADTNLSSILKDKNIILSKDGIHIEKTTASHRGENDKQYEQGVVARHSFSHIIGKHPILEETKIIAQKLAKTNLPILIEGETGTGKELFAQAIHNESWQAPGPFRTVTCSTLSKTQFENDALFGLDDVSATADANNSQTQTLIKRETGGTIFFDEISDLNLRSQAHLLHLLQEMATAKVPINLRVIAATNKDLLMLIDEGSFREDLYYRLNVLSLRLPSLQDISSDIPGLIAHFISKSGKTIKVDKAVVAKLSKYLWYGNVRELKNTIEYMLTVCDGHSIQLHDIPPDRFKKQSQKKTKAPVDRKEKQEGLSIMEKKEHYFILETIMECNENGEPASRRIIADKSKKGTNPLTTQQIRHRLDFLEKHGFVTKGRGRAGTKITSEGLDFFQSLETYII